MQSMLTREGKKPKNENKQNEKTPKGCKPLEVMNIFGLIVVMLS